MHSKDNLSSASPPVEGRYTSDAAGQIYRDGSLCLQVSLNTRPDDRKAIAAGVAAILNAPSPPVEQSEGLVGRLKALACDCDAGEGNNWEDHEWRDAADLLRRAASALTPPPVTVEEVERVGRAMLDAEADLSGDARMTDAEWDRLKQLPEYEQQIAVMARAAIAALKEGHSLSTVSGVVK